MTTLSTRVVTVALCLVLWVAPAVQADEPTSGTASSGTVVTGTASDGPTVDAPLPGQGDDANANAGGGGGNGCQL